MVQSCIPKSQSLLARAHLGYVCSPCDRGEGVSIAWHQFIQLHHMPQRLVVRLVLEAYQPKRHHESMTLDQLSDATREDIELFAEMVNYPAQFEANNPTMP